MSYHFEYTRTVARPERAAAPAPPAPAPPTPAPRTVSCKLKWKILTLFSVQTDIVYIKQNLKTDTYTFPVPPPPAPAPPPPAPAAAEESDAENVVIKCNYLFC